jgi:hypothetical protein
MKPTLLLALILLPACATTKQSVEVQVIHAEHEPSVVATYKCEIP